MRRCFHARDDDTNRAVAAAVVTRRASTTARGGARRRGRGDGTDDSDNVYNSTSTTDSDEEIGISIIPASSSSSKTAIYWHNARHKIDTTVRTTADLDDITDGAVDLQLLFDEQRISPRFALWLDVDDPDLSSAREQLVSHLSTVGRAPFSAPTQHAPSEAVRQAKTRPAVSAAPDGELDDGCLAAGQTETTGRPSQPASAGGAREPGRPDGHATSLHLGLNLAGAVTETAAPQEDRHGAPAHPRHVAVLRPSFVSRGFSQSDIELLTSSNLLVQPWTSAKFRPLHAFKVPKSNGLARFIIDCRPLNDIWVNDLPCVLPRIDAVVNELLARRFAATCDAKSFFYQLRLPPILSECISVKVAAIRGAHQLLFTTKVPMGLHVAPPVAQHAATAVLDAAGPVPDGAWRAAYIDNFVFAAGDAETAQAMLNDFLVAAAHYNLELKEPENATQHIKILGVHFDLAEGVASLDDDKQKEMVDFPPPTTPRDVLRAWGSVAFANYALGGRPLCFYDGPLRVLRQACSVGLRVGWDTPFAPPWGESAQLLRDAAAQTRTRALVVAQRSAPAIRSIAWTDASENFLAAILQRDGAADEPEPQLQIPVDRAWGVGIFVLEMAAVAHAVLTWSPDAIATDNTAVHRAIIKGYSTVPAANALLRLIFSAVQGRQLYVAWVPTDRQRADPLSRDEHGARRIEAWRPAFDTAKWC